MGEIADRGRRLVESMQDEPIELENAEDDAEVAA
jgi:hypothetical protein